MPRVHKTVLPLEVEVEYQEFPEDTELDLPPQVEIVGIFALPSENSPRARRANLLYSLSEAEVINLEDEILGDL
jgi:hypothetical protein